MFINHRKLEIFKRAFPHLDNSSQRTVNIILKMADLNDSIYQFTHQNDIEACDTNSHTNFEELLRSIKPLCSKKDQEIIDFALNFNKSRDVFNAYKTINNMDNTSDEHRFDCLKNKLSPEQICTLNNLSKIMNNQ